MADHPSPYVNSGEAITAATTAAASAITPGASGSSNLLAVLSAVLTALEPIAVTDATALGGPLAGAAVSVVVPTAVADINAEAPVVISAIFTKLASIAAALEAKL